MARDLETATLALPALPRLHGLLLLSAFAAVLGGAALSRFLPFPAKRRYLGVSASSSNLADEFSHPSTATSETCTVKALYIYPIKSCRGVEVTQADVVATGFRWDRQFTFAERQEDGEWKFVTQRQYPLLAQVRTALDPDREMLMVRWRWWRGFEVSLKEPSGAETAKVKVWKDAPEAWKLPVQLEGLRSFLGAKGELALCRVKELREVHRCAPRREELGWQPVTGFADAVRSREEKGP
jgi:uncharacterized protein YcbX